MEEPSEDNREQGKDMSDDPLLREHQDNWKGFVRLITYSTAFVVLILVGMALFLVCAAERLSGPSRTTMGGPVGPAHCMSAAQFC